MSGRRARTFVLFASLSCVLACNTDKETRSANAPEPVRPGAYSEGTDGLRTFFEDMMKALAAGQTARARTMARSLELATPEVWFKQVFGPELGKELFADYKPLVGSFGSFADTVQGLREKGQDRLLVERFESADDDAAVGYQAQALGRMKRATPLYSVRAVDADGATVFHLWSFVYQDGYFRWIGKTHKAAEDKLGPNEFDAREYRVRDAEAAKKALSGEGEDEGKDQGKDGAGGDKSGDKSGDKGKKSGKK